MLNHRLRKAVINNNCEVASISSVRDSIIIPEPKRRQCPAAGDRPGGVVIAPRAHEQAPQLPARLSAIAEKLPPKKEHKAVAKSLAKRAGGYRRRAGAVQSAFIADPGNLRSDYRCHRSTLLFVAVRQQPPVPAWPAPCRTAVRPVRSQGSQAVSTRPRFLTRAQGDGADGRRTRCSIPTWSRRCRKTGVRYCRRAVSTMSSSSNRPDLVLPLASVVESSGSSSMSKGCGKVSRVAWRRSGESRQGWKILAALGQVLQPDDFEYVDSVAGA